MDRLLIMVRGRRITVVFHCMVMNYDSMLGCFRLVEMRPRCHDFRVLLDGDDDLLICSRPRDSPHVTW